MASSGIAEIQMPQMGESVTEGTVLEWHKQEGDFVQEGEILVEVSTDKYAAEVPAPASGVVTKILKGEDETIEVGAVLAELDPAAEPSGDGAGGPPAAVEERETPPGFAEGEVGEGNADLGDEAAGSESAQPGLTEAPAATAAPDGELVQISMP